MKPEFEEFRYLSKVMRRLQVQRAIELSVAEREGSPKAIPLDKAKLDGDFVFSAIKEGFKFKETDNEIFLTKNEQYLALIVHPRAKLNGDLQELAGLLHLEADLNSPQPAIFEIESAKEGWIQPTFANASAFPAEPEVFGESDFSILPCPVHLKEIPLRKDIIVSTRSLLEVMFYLSQGVNVPLAHQSKGVVTMTFDAEGAPFDWNEMMHDLFVVHHCKHRPKNAAVAVQHRGYWFYIDERDRSSLATYSLLVEMFGIEVRGGGGGGFLYTLGI